MTTTNRSRTARQLLSKVPEVTIYFWVIKVLCTTVGETAADFLNVNLNLGLNGTSVLTGVLLVIALVFQFWAPRYIPTVYWLTVTLVSVFGTLVTDNLTTNLDLPLEASTLLFSGLLTVTFLAWYLSERTLSIHSIYTRRREAFYWLAILFTFALGTAAGDLISEGLGLGYLLTGIIVAALIALTAIGWKLGVNSVLCFWIIYILTRPLGASIGDFLSQPGTYGGIGLGATITSIIFLVAIVVTVLYLSVTRADVISGPSADQTRTERGGLWQTLVVVGVLVIAGGTGYHLRMTALETDSSDTGSQSSTTGGQSTPGSPLGDLSTFRTITQDTLNLVVAGDQAGATNRVGDLEHEWDTAQARLKSKDGAAWTDIDGKIDTVLRELRAVNPDPAREQAALTGLLAGLG
jgi:uncharacterized membrane-anchored protein